MRIIKVVMLVLLGVFVVLQFFRPPLNVAANPPEHALLQRFPVPDSVRYVLKRSCFDCHSNTTDYPWYSYIMPAGWVQWGDIRDGKHALNFDEFTSYPAAKQFHRFADIREQLEEGNMPLPKYLLLHRSAVLSDAEKALLVEWTESMRDTMRQWYPIDSLQHSRRSPQSRMTP